MLRRVLALFAVLAMMAGPPFLLLAWGFTDWSAIHVWSATDVRVLLGALTIAGWVAWAAWMVALVVESVIALSGRRLRVTLPGFALPRAVASALITTILASGAASVAQAAPPAARAAVVPQAVPVAEAEPAAGEAEVQELAQDATDDVGPTHTVTGGDDLWSLAQRYYGDGARWRTIVAANPKLQADPMARLVPGTVLSVPDPVVLVTVRPGDTLSRLALAHLGDVDRWPEILALNTQRIKDPDLIMPGWVLSVPMVPGEIPDAPVSAPGPVAPAPVQLEAGDGAAPVASGSTTVAEARTDAPEPDILAPESDASPAAGLLGGMTALSAAAVIGGIGVRRRIQGQARPLGRRYAQPVGELSRYEAALTQVAHDEELPDRISLLARAMRVLARHWWEQRQPALPLARALVGPEEVEFFFALTPPSAPEGFVRVGDSLIIGWAALAGLPDVDHPVAYPALVTLGEQAPGVLVMVDVVAAGVLGVRDDGDGAEEMLSAMLMELACAPWAAELNLHVVTRDARFAEVAGEGRIVCDREVEDGVATLERLVRQRSRFIGGRAWDDGRLDPDLAEAWSPQVVLFEVAPRPDQLARLEAAVAAHPCGVAAVAAVGAQPAASVDWVLSTDAAGVRRLADARGDSADRATIGVTPQTVGADTRRALTELHHLANATTTEPAPWWRNPSEDDLNIIALRPLPVPEPKRGPRLNLLGPVDMLGCAGPAPTRAVRQAVEYCAWLLLHPGSTPQQMGAALLVADGTRRSNMSRLRSWLGSDPSGALYLPDAYSGRIQLSEEVGSDWDELLVLTAGGVNRQSLERLVAALELVRGAPLADAAPSQWGWAEEFRTDAAALIRDVGVVAARLARERGDLDTSRWAANRALAAAPDDELLLGERIRTEHRAGREDEVERLVNRVARTARTLGVDLLPETVDLCQEVIEGRVRARV